VRERGGLGALTSEGAGGKRVRARQRRVRAVVVAERAGALVGHAGGGAAEGVAAVDQSGSRRGERGEGYLQLEVGSQWVVNGAGASVQYADNDDDDDEEMGAAADLSLCALVRVQALWWEVARRQEEMRKLLSAISRPGSMTYDSAVKPVAGPGLAARLDSVLFLFLFSSLLSHALSLYISISLYLSAHSLLFRADSTGQKQLCRDRCLRKWQSVRWLISRGKGWRCSVAEQGGRRNVPGWTVGS